MVIHKIKRFFHSKACKCPSCCIPPLKKKKAVKKRIIKKGKKK